MVKKPRYVLYIYYYEEENLFRDSDGNIIYDIFTLITPQDLMMFKHDSGYSIFPIKGTESSCEIYTVPDEVCGDQKLNPGEAIYEGLCDFLNDEIPLINVGDDYERLARYAETINTGYYI